MKCRVCGQPPTGADDLCGDCARALKRAREGSSAVRNTPPPETRKARGVTKIMLSSPLAMPLAVPPRGRLALWGLLVASAILLAFTATRGVEYTQASVTKVASRPVRPPVVQMLEPELVADTEDSDARPTRVKGADSSAHVASTSGVPQVPPAGRSTRVQATAMSGTGAQSSADAGVSDAARSSTSNGQGSDAATQLAKANVPASGSSPDDSQSLAVALERCNGEKFLAGVICEQKVRLRYCEGRWGQVPQCTPKARVD